jgi:hypothetical protein
MKLKLYEIVNSEDALKELGSLKLSAKLSYKISKNVKKIVDELREYNTLKNKLIVEKYGTQNESGNFQVMKENLPDFVKELNELLESEVDVDIYPVELDDSIILSVDHMSALSWLFLEQETPVENK